MKQLPKELMMMVLETKTQIERRERFMKAKAFLEEHLWVIDMVSHNEGAYQDWCHELWGEKLHLVLSVQYVEDMAVGKFIMTFPRPLQSNIGLIASSSHHYFSVTERV